MKSLQKTNTFFKSATWFCAVLLTLILIKESSWTAQGILDFNRFMSEIEPLLLTQTYNSPAAGTTCFSCHGNAADPAYSAYPLVIGEPRNNFIETARRVQLANPGTGLLMLKPLALAAGGLPHGLVANAGGEQFPNTADNDYRTILEWIRDATLSSVGARITRTDAYPNPFRFHTDIVYFLTTEALQVEVMVFAENGHQLQTFRGTGNVGANRIRWDGRDVDLEPLPTGVYFYLVKAQFEDGTSFKKGKVVYTP